MSRRTSMGYLTILGFTFQAARYESSMKRNLLKMTTSADRATTLETSATSDESLSAQTALASAQTEAHGQSLLQTATLLQTQSEEDASLATANHASAAKFQASSEQQHAKADAVREDAATEEALADTLQQKSDTEAAEATMLESELEADAASATACEFVPLLDVLCDLIGAASAVGIQNRSARLAVEAAADSTAAASARVTLGEDVEAAEALDAVAAEDANQAAGLENQAEKEEAEAEALQTQAEQDRSEGKELVAKGTEMEAASEEEEVKAEAETGEAAEQWEAFGKYALASFWDALCSAFVSFFALFYFLLRTVVDHFIPFADTLFRFLPGGFGSTSRNTSVSANLAIPQANASRALLHCLTFATTASTLSPRIHTVFQQNHSSSFSLRGELVMAFAILAGISQALLLHVLPHSIRICKDTHDRDRSTIWKHVCSVGCTFFSSVSFLVPLFVLEALIVWINFFSSANVGKTTWTHARSNIVSIRTFVCWTLLLFGVAFHHWTFGVIESSDTTTATSSSKTKGFHVEDDEKDDQERHDEEWGKLIEENDPLIMSESSKSKVKQRLEKDVHRNLPKHNSSSSSSSLGNIISTTTSVLGRKSDKENGNEKKMEKEEDKISDLDTITLRSNKSNSSPHRSDKTESILLVPKHTTVSNPSYSSLSSHTNSDNCNPKTSKVRTYSNSVPNKRPLISSSSSLSSSSRAHALHSTLQVLTLPLELATTIYDNTAKHFSGLRLPFEIFVISCMVALLKSCLPNFRILWPVIKSKLGDVAHTHPYHLGWWYLGAVGLGIFVLFAIWYWLLRMHNERYCCSSPSSRGKRVPSVTKESISYIDL